MDSLKIRFVFDRKKEANNTSIQGLLQVEVYDRNPDNKGKKKVYISTGIKLLANQFVQKRGEIGKVKNHPKATELQGKAMRTYRGVESFILSDRCKSIEDVKNWDKKLAPSLDFIKFLENELRLKSNSLSVGTIKYHKTIINRIVSFGKLSNFTDLTYDNIVSFDYHMREKGLSDISVYKNHVILRQYVQEAINKDIIEKSPYYRFHPKKGKSKEPVYLEEHEIDLLLNCDKEIKEHTDSDRLIKVRDLFIFQCFTGLSYSDLMKLTKEEINEIDGVKVIKSNRVKTDQNFISVILPEAINILEKYNYELPRISNQKYNDYLKLVGLYAKDKKTKQSIKKRLTTHVARHTFATYLINKGVPLETVAQTMGHSNIKMTQHYAKLLGKKVVSDVLNYVINPNKEKL